MNKRKKIAFVTADDPFDKRSWSGIHHRMLVALREEFDEVVPLGPIRLSFLNFILRIFKFIISFFFNKKYNNGHSIFLSKIYAILLKRKLHKNNFDVIFAASASTLIANLKTNIPIFYYADATVNNMIDYYDSVSNLVSFSIKESNFIERKAISNAKVSIFASSWAANDAINFYKAIPENTYVIKMGANIEKTPNEINLEDKFKQNECNLLFLGVDWKRKGGDIAFKTFELLIKSGFKANLIVCGCIPPHEHPQMTVYPFLNKNLNSDHRIFIKLLDKAHFLFLPTRAECAGIVFCEAAANSIPSIATNTGGVSSYVQNGINGYTLPFSATHEEYARIIRNTFSNKELYLRLSSNARKLYFKELNWNSWAKKIKEIITNTTL